MKPSRWLRLAPFAAFVLLYLPSLAFAGGGPLGFSPSIGTWALILGAITPAFTYVLNHYAPWVSEHAKATVLLLVSGVVGAVYTLIETGSIGWSDPTVAAIVTAILGAFGAHALFWKPSTLSTKLGGGSNVATPARKRR
jgi:hypothetical protein